MAAMPGRNIVSIEDASPSSADAASAGASSHTAKAAGAALPALTGLRFCAAFYVVMEHSAPWLEKHFRLPTPLRNFFDNGYLAVCLFFLLSGFILSYTYASSR